MFEDTVNNVVEYTRAIEASADTWVVAGGGMETPFVARDGRTYLYVFNPATSEHGMLDMATDIVTDDREFYMTHGGM